VDVVVEASGAPGAVRAAFELIGVGGVIVLVGSVFPSPPVPIDPEDLVRRLVTVRGVHNYDPRDLSGAVAYLHDRGTAYPFAGLVGARHPLAGIDRALAEAGEGHEIRVAVDPSLS
jgi:threonine dehydrogenase-like Zn-dependent dehydrogenase